MAIVIESIEWKKHILVLLAICLVASIQIQESEKIAFLDVGQGDAILLQDGNQQVLIDGGEGLHVFEQLPREMPWFDRSIELVIITHPQRDHMEGLLHMMERYDVGLVLFPRVVNDSLLQEELINKIIEKNIQYRFGWAGERVAVGDISLSIVSPFDTPEAKALIATDVNNASVSARVDFHGLSMLLTGDMEAPAEYLLIKQVPSHIVDVDILKAGHHGSRTSTTKQLLTATTPKLVAISVGQDNTFGHPHPTVLSRLEGIPILRTDEMGTIRIERKEDVWTLHSSSRVR